MGSKTQNLFSQFKENIPPSNSIIVQHDEDEPCVPVPEFHLAKYDDIQEIYREELAPTSVSVARMRSTGEKVAIKKIFKSFLVNDFQRKQAVQECVLHCSLDHPNIVKAQDWSEDDNEYSLIMECVNHPTYFKEKVETRLRPIKNEDKLKSYISDILEALVYLHSKGIVHGDLKLENILLNKNEGQERSAPTLKLCDFGLSRMLDKDTKKFFMEFAVGSTTYMAPEIKAKTYVNEKIDIWALGIVLYKMAVAYKPTQISGYKYGSGPIPFRKIDWRKRSPELQDLITEMLKVNPDERISAQEALNHPWFRRQNDS